MRSKRLGVLVLVLGFVGSASAYASSITSHAGFSASETVITFNDVVGEGTVAVGGQYAAQGVTFSGVLYGYATSYTGLTGSASGGGLAGDFQNNSCPCFNDVTVTFAGTVLRAGFDAYGNSGDSIELKAYRSGVLVDDETFPMPHPGFVGVDVPGGFDSLVIHPFGGTNGAYVMDDFRFDGSAGAAWVPPPPHAAVCSVAGNTNPFTGAPIAPGTFLDLLAAQITSDPHYAGATPAIFVEGKGLTCDPPSPGYVQKGYAGDAQHVAEGYYPYYAPATTTSRWEPSARRR